MTDEDLNVKKDRPPVRSGRVPVGAVRRTLFAGAELMRGFSLASADGWRAFGNAVDPEVSRDGDFARDASNAMFDANKRFVDDVTDSSRQFFDRVMDEGARISPTEAEGIDYERLARMVAEELRRQPGTSDAGAPGPEGTTAD